MNIKKLGSLIIVIFFSINLFSAEKNFRCLKNDISEKAKGTYEVNQYNQFLYYYPDGKVYNLFSNVDSSKLGIKIEHISAASNAFEQSGNEFYTFDNNGNIYFLIEINYGKKGKVYSGSGVASFNPLTQKTTCLFAKENSYTVSFCVSADGSYLFYAFHIYENTTNYFGYSYVYAIPTQTPEQTEIIWEPYFDYPHLNGIENICFDANINALYFTVDGWNHDDDCGNGHGLYRLKADSNGKYKAENTERLSYLKEWHWGRLIERTEKTKDYKYLTKALKKHCGAFINPDDFEINLSYFSDVSSKLSNGKKYAALYKTDSNGNPLKEEQALTHLLKNKQLFNSFIIEYNNSQNRKLSVIPLDTICFYKGTDKPAFNYEKYRTFFESKASSRIGWLYSNKDGLFGVYYDDDVDVSSSIYHLTDNKGNFLGTQENGLDTVKFQSLGKLYKPIFVDDNSLTWLDINQKKIYQFKNNTLTLLVDGSKDNHNYTYEEVKQIAEEGEIKKNKQKEESIQSSADAKDLAENSVDNSIIQEINSRLQYNQETIEALLSKQEQQLNFQNDNQYQNQINNLSAENSNLQSELDLLTAESQRNEKTRRLFIILFAVFLLISIILFIILITNYTIQTKKLNEIKNNKKFIFDIQEAERAKISRDIHDSVIQDIRSIRIDAELIKTTDNTEVRKEQIINTATQCVVKLRNICYNLTPAELMTHEQGDSSKIELISIIQSLVLQFIEKTHVPCQLKIDENFEYPVFSKEISQNLFRIIQEALNNIEKHSYATNCQIFIKNKIENDKKYMLIYISDDGIGCNIEQILKKHKKDHFGIQNMKDRAELVGASISFQSEQGQGMEIRIQI